jgi:hypothetical protein
MTSSCPVCHSELDFEPWIGESASFEICPSCGIHFGYNDARSDLRLRIYIHLREAWIANGRRALQGEAWRDVSVRIIQRVQEEGRAD